jgi:phosphatidylglycerol:prolipoprotein diacylglycerol transferase
VHPDLFHLFGIAVPSYFVLLLSGFLFATAVGVLWARRIGENADAIVDLGIAMLLAGVAGARILHVLADGYFWDYVHLCTDPSRVEWPLDKAECLAPVSSGWGGAAQPLGVWDAARGVCHPPGQDCFAWARFWAGGLTYYGGFLGAAAAAWFLLRRDQFPFWKAADMAGFAVPLGLAFGRMGCLMAGCCFGATSDLPWAMSFPWRSPASEAQFKEHLLPSARMWSLPVHPTQVYESAASLAIAAVCLLWIHPRKRYDGQVFVAFLGLYAVARFGLEVLRRDDRGGLLGLSTSQLLGVAMLAAAAGLHAWLGRRGRAAGLASPTPFGGEEPPPSRPPEAGGTV